MSAAEKVLTVQMPWALDIIAGRKDVENRTWKPPVRAPFRLWIHAGKTYDRDAYYDRQPTREQCASRMGKILGFVTVTNVHHEDDGCLCGCSEWAMPDQWHWHLAGAHVIDPVPARGRLGLWDLPTDVVKQDVAS
jgi:hypothetical protein